MNRSNTDTASPLNFDEFTASTREEWRAAAEAGLKGASFDKKLVTRTPEGIDLQPIYFPADIEGLSACETLPGFDGCLRASRASGCRARTWDVAQTIAEADAGRLREILHRDLNRGQTAVRIVLDRAGQFGLDPDMAEPESVGVGGLSLVTLEDLRKALKEVDLAATPVFLQGGVSGMGLMAFLMALSRERGTPTGLVQGAVEADPLHEWLTRGSLPYNPARAFDHMFRGTRWAVRHAPSFQTIAVRDHAFHNAGSSAVQDVAFSLATGLEYLRQMTNRGLSVDQAFSKIRFFMSAGPDFFMTIARLRAARMLWARVAGECGGDAESGRMKLHVRTGLWNKSLLDPHVNLLRVTAEAFAAIAGGCDSLETGAYDELFRSPDEFSRRVARNTQIILRDECQLDRVIDPAGGSWYVEKLTHEFAKRAWDLFRETERQGGMMKAIETGWVQRQVKEVSAQKRKAIDTRRTGLVGVNLFSNPNEEVKTSNVSSDPEFLNRRARVAEQHRTTADHQQQLKVLERLNAILDSGAEEAFDLAIEAVEQGATFGEIVQVLRHGDEPSVTVEKLEMNRAAGAFEQLRLAVAQSVAKTGARPKVFFANMGPLRQHKARADFCRAFLETAAFDVESPAGFNSAEEAIQAALKSRARIVVICSTDDTYPELVPPLAGGIKAQAPDKIVLLAGLPPEQEQAFREAGVDDFIHLKANCYQLLKSLLTQLGILS